VKRFWLLAGLLLVAYDVYLFGWRLAEVQGNVEAQFIIVTPAFVVSHLLHKRRADRQHAERMAAHERTEAKLDQLHQHLGITLPATD
jgi:hypothetical protein